MASLRRDDEGVQGRKVFLIDDHPIVRQGLTHLVNQERDLQVCGTAAEAREALQGVEQARPDVAVVDITLGRSCGLDLVRDLHARYPDLPILVLSMHDETLFAERALRAGARGYIMKKEATQDVVEAIRRVLDGALYVSEAMAARMVHGFITGHSPSGASPIGRLTDRELQVFQCIGRGMTTREIAQSLHLSVKTIESHRAHIKEKLGLKTTTELLVHAIQRAQTAGSS